MSMSHVRRAIETLKADRPRWQVGPELIAVWEEGLQRFQSEEVLEACQKFLERSDKTPSLAAIVNEILSLRRSRDFSQPSPPAQADPRSTRDPEPWENPGATPSECRAWRAWNGYYDHTSGSRTRIGKLGAFVRTEPGPVLPPAPPGTKYRQEFGTWSLVDLPKQKEPQ